MKHNPFAEFYFQLIALMISIIVVHSIYITVIRPEANEALRVQAERQAAGDAEIIQRSGYIIVKDYEQEACFILMLWATAIMGFKARQSLQERKFFKDALSAKEREYLLPRTLLSALQRFDSTKNIQDVSTAIKEASETQAERLDSELSMIRYIVWAIPSIGFIGTVRGIGQALGQAHRAVEGDIVGVTVSLGVAFNSTFVALIISLFIMFIMHQLQLMQERLVLDSQSFCDVNLLRHLSTRE